MRKIDHIHRYILISVFVVFCHLDLYAIQDAIKFRVERQTVSTTDECVIRFNSSATRGFDGGWDAYKLFSSNVNVPSIHSKSNNGIDLSINAYPALLRDVQISLYLLTQVSDSLILSKAILGSFQSTTEIFIEDLVSEDVYAIDDLPITIWSQASAQPQERFKVHFVRPVIPIDIESSCMQQSTGSISIANTYTEVYEYALLFNDDTIVTSQSNHDTLVLEELSFGDYELFVNTATGFGKQYTFQIDAYLEPVLEVSLQQPTSAYKADGQIAFIEVDSLSYHFKWSTGESGTHHIENLFPGRYSVSIEDSFTLCKWYRSFELIAPVQNETFGYSQDALVYDFEEDGLMDEPNDGEGEVFEIVSDERVESPNNISVFPNPAIDKVTIQSPSRQAEIALYSVNGTLLRQQVHTSQTTDLDISELKKGTYFISIVDFGGGNAQTFKVLKQ